MLVALTPDGLRPDSVVRFAQRASQLPETLLVLERGDLTSQPKLCPCEELVESTLEGTLELEIRRLSHATYSIFGLIWSDTFDGVDNIEHPPSHLECKFVT